MSSTLGETAYRAQVRTFSRFGSWVSSSNWTVFTLICVGCLVAGGLITGNLFSSYENDTVALYSHSQSRLHHELNVLKSTFGLSRKEAAIFTSSTGNIGTVDGMESIINTLLPIFREDESASCLTLDGDTTTVPQACDIPPYSTDSVYCGCNKTASSPDQIVITYSGLDESGHAVDVELSQKDFCESPEVPPSLKPGEFPYIPASDPKSLSSYVFLATLEQELQSSTDLSFSGSSLYSSIRDGAAVAGAQAFHTSEAALSRSDFTNSGLAAFVRLVIFVGSAASKMDDPAFNDNGLEAMWGSLALNSSLTDSERQAIYLAGVGADDGKKIFASTSYVSYGVSVLTIASGMGSAITTAFSSAQYGYVSQGNVISHSYQAVAACVADYTDNNRVNMLDAIFDATILYKSSIDEFLSVTTFNVSVYDENGVAAAKSYLEAQLAMGVDLETDTATQEEAFTRVLANSANPAQAIIDGEKARLAPTSFNDNGLAAALEVGISLYLQGADLTSAASEQDISVAYTSNGGSVAVIGDVQDMVQLAAPIHVQVNQRAVTACIEGVIGNVLAPSLVMPLTATINGTLRPLPRTWGFDRFPCTRISPIDVFNEGDFDLPLNMKFLDHISIQLASFFSQTFFAHFAAESNCYALHVTNPLKEAIYLQMLPAAATYQNANFDAFSAAEEAYRNGIAAGMDAQNAASAGLIAFISNGGKEYLNEAPRTPISVQLADQQAIATAIATAAGTADFVSDQFTQSLSTFAAFGYHYRPSFEGMSDGNITQTLLSAINNTLNVDVTSEDCVRGNVDACLLAWSSRKVPPEVAFGETTINAVVSGRLIANNWNEHAPLYHSRVEAKLNRNVTTDEFLELHLLFEKAVTDYLLPIFSSDASSGYGTGEPFSSENVDFTMERSVSDAVTDAGSTNIELIICAVVILVVYTAFSAYNLWSSLFSHSLLAIWGLITVVVSTGAALGLTAYGGIKFTPITTSVVPFLAIGIGIDDMFVIIRAFSRECQDRNKLEGLVSRVLGETGPSVALTSFTNLVAFSIAAITPIEIVQGFALQMSISVFLNFVFLMLMFVPALAWDAKRVFSNKPDALIMCCHDEGRARAPSVLDLFFEGIYSKFILSKPARIVIPLVFMLWFGIAFWQGFFVTPTGLRLSQVANDGSFVYDFAVANEADFLMYDAQIITRTDNFPAAQSVILSSLDALQAASSVASVPSIASTYWLTDLIAFYGNGTNPIPEENFYEVFSSWLGATGTVYLGDLICKDSVTQATASCSDIVGAFSSSPPASSNPNIVLDTVRGIFYLQNLRETSDFTNSIDETRTILDTINAMYIGSDPSYSSFAIGYTYVFWEQYLYTDFDLYFVVGLCLVGVFIATFISQMNFVTTITICTFVFMIVVEVFGLMNAWGIEKNAFSLVNLCLAIGMGVEFTAHIAHQFQAEEAPDKVARARQTLGFMGTAMFHGAASSILATLFIAGSDTGFIREYYFGMFFATIVVSFLNGMIFLPVVLSVFGPAPYNISEDFVGDDEDKGDEDGAHDFDDMVTHARTAMTPIKVTSEWGESDFNN
eukprot:m.99840 g.99840  ORF g.99840 m.99840 type:complete len:1558 (+) comp9034_c2_seq1:60-4733(+)